MTTMKFKLGDYKPKRAKAPVCVVMQQFRDEISPSLHILT